MAFMVSDGSSDGSTHSPAGPQVSGKGWCEKWFEQNLEALRAVQPSLVASLRVAQPIGLDRARNGQPTCRWAVGAGLRWLHSAYEPGLEAQRLAALAPADAEAVLLVGAGLGYTPAQLVAQRPGLRVVVLEPELRLVRTMLGLFDLADPLTTGRLVLLTGDDAEQAAVSRIPARPFVIKHPALRSVYADRYRHVQYLIQRGKARWRIIAFDSKLIMADLVPLLQAEGIAVRSVRPQDVRIESFGALCQSVRPSFVLAINFSPEIALLCSKLGVPYVSWTIDPLPTSRQRLLGGTNPRNCLAFGHRRQWVAELRRWGLADAQYLPLGAPMGKRRPIDEEQRLAPYRCRVSFAGSSLANEWSMLMDRLKELGADDVLVSKVAEWLNQSYEQQRDDSAYRGLADDGSQLPQWLLTSLSNEAPREELTDRINGALSHLLRKDRVRTCLDFGIHLYGDDGWEDFGQAYRGRAQHGDELTTVYNASTVNLDVPRIYQRDIVTMRVFDIMLCEGLVLTEASAELLELFDDGEHLLTYRDRASLRQAIEQISRQPERYDAIVRAGRKLVQNHHLLSHRLETILQAVRQRGWLA